MSGNSLEERLKSNSNAFDGLLSLIPAKYYYDGKTQEQWKCKKKTKNQVRQDRIKKLDPDQQDQESFSALEVMKEREEQGQVTILPEDKYNSVLNKFISPGDTISNSQKNNNEDEEEQGDINVMFDDDGNVISTIDNESCMQKQKISSVKVSKRNNNERKKKMEELRVKLQEKIQSMKEKRKAPGTKVDGALISRDDILAQRKKKQDLKQKRLDEEKLKQHESSEESELDSDSDLNDLLPVKKNQHDEVSVKDVMFQNIVFNDGTKATSDLQHLRKCGKKVGPAKNDIKSHLKLVETRQAKIATKDELEQIKIKEKAKWQKAMLQAEGINLKDDEKLLRKALKRKETKKKKSAIEWKERKQVVASNITEKQKRREENLAIRKENKGKKKSKQKKMKRKFKVTGIARKRAGFEGRLKSGKKI